MDKYAHIGKILFDVKPQDTMAQGSRLECNWCFKL